MDFKLTRKRADAFSKEEVVSELKRVAEMFSNRSFSTRDFDRKSASCSAQTVLRNFGTWKAALASIGIEFCRTAPARNKTTNHDLFGELERIWRILGHRPSRQEWLKQKAKFSHKAYERRFGGWVPACVAFIEYKSEMWSDSDAGKTAPITQPRPPIQRSEKIASRDIPLKIRFRVLDRDGYRCVLCGRSPATDAGIRLHLDHIVAFSKGGQNTEANLRTLCQNCNWGKGAD